MAQLILTRAGAALGGRIAPAGLRAAFSAFGRAAGAAIGQRIDNALFGVDRHSEGPRQAGFALQGSTEGASLPNVYGRMRVAGQVIWAARFKEHAKTQSSGGGKSGAPRQSQTNYSYSISFAVGLCEGVISGIDRVWANGQLLDLSGVTMRVHRGHADQPVDPLIEALEGAPNAPAFRDLAYVVFEDLQLEPFGGAIPQLSFEVVRPPPQRNGPPGLESLARGVCLIPGSGEFALATTPMRRMLGPGIERGENLHAASDRSDFVASLDQLQRDLPHIESVMLVVGWFGDDLRCGECTIAPRIDNAVKQTRPLDWAVAGLNRTTARLVSSHGGGPAFGGTPSDQTVIEAMAEIKRRGLKVGLYPFLFMDVPAGNALPDPYGGAAQAAYPWRGRISPHPAIGQTGAVDKTAAVASQVASFFGAAQTNQFAVQPAGVTYNGPQEWRYRRFILHYAALAAAAGGVDAFVIGSELKQLTSARSNATTFPAVAALTQLAQDVRSFLPNPCVVTYGADWSEYGAYAPQDGSGDVLFPLDPLWASSAISAVGVDWYPPLTDWRDGVDHRDAEVSADGRDPAYLHSRIEGGEAYDWFYANAGARAVQNRTAIQDGAHGEHWVFRAKDLRGWWSHAHHPRPGGARAATPSPWVAQSKPIWLIELGCPAIDKGANQPNLFTDPKSAETGAPFASSGARDDVIQRRTLEAYLRWISDPAMNPTSSVYGGPMIAADGVHLWCWDARPFPAFPARADVWSDGGNWRLGHWLNGRAGGGELGDVLVDLCARAGVANVDASAVRGIVAGFVVDAPSTTRAAIEPLLDVYGLDLIDSAGVLRFAHIGAAPVIALAAEDVVDRAEALASVHRADPVDLPSETRLRFIDPAADWAAGLVSARRRDNAARGVATVDAPLALDATAAVQVVQALHGRALAARDSAQVQAPPHRIDLEPADRIDLSALAIGGVWRIDRIEDGGVRTLKLSADIAPADLLAGVTPAAPPAPAIMARPVIHVLDLPPLPGAEAFDGPWAAVFAAPWAGSYEIFAGDNPATASKVGEVSTAATLGVLASALPSGPAGRWLYGAGFEADLVGPPPSAIDPRRVLDGGNGFAVRGADGRWHVLQAADIALIGPGRYRFGRVLRGGQGGGVAVALPIGSPIVALNAALARLEPPTRLADASQLWIAAANGFGANAADAGQSPATWARRWGQPFAPAHLKAERAVSGDIALSWVRCARVQGDDWGPTEPAAESGGESYRVEIWAGGVLRRGWTAPGPAASYDLAAQTADFAGPAGAFTLRVAQISDIFGIGAFGESAVAV